MKLFFALIFSITSFSSFAQVRDSDILPNIKTDIQNPFEMRDPFKREFKRQSSLDVSRTKFTSENFVNVGEIGEISLDRIRIVGVLLGKERRALARILTDTGERSSNDNDPTYVIKEGMTLGMNKGVVKAILPGGIVVVEEITNVYDKKEYLETVIPISNL